MNNIITYFYLETEENNNKYGITTSNLKKKNEYYFRCIVNFFYSSLKYNENSKHYFICNEEDNLEFIKDFNFKGFLNENNIELIKINSKYVKKNTRWAGSMFLFDAIEYFKNNVNLSDNYIFCDNDILINYNLEDDDIFLTEFDYIAYDVTHECKKDKNTGKWISDFNGMNQIYMEDEKFIHLGGEFFVLKGAYIEKFIEKFCEIKNQSGLFTEEHFLSYLNAYHSDNVNTILLDNTNNIIKRTWTSLKYSNVKKSDIYIKIIHLPSEKEYGLKWLSKNLIKNGIYNKEIALKYNGIPKRSIFFKIRLISEKILRKLQKIKPFLILNK